MEKQTSLIPAILRFLLGLGFLAVLSVAIFVFATKGVALDVNGIGGENEQRGLVVTGEGEVSVKPDVATFTVSVRADGENSKVAEDNASRQMSGIINSLKAEGIEQKDLKTSSFDVYEDFRYDDEGNRIEEGYVASQSLTVTVRQVDRSSAFLDIATNAGATDVYGLDFSVDDNSKYADEARVAAITDARQRAEKLAAAAGKELGDVIAIIDGDDELDFLSRYSGLEAASDEFGSGTPDIEAGEETVSRTVTIQFELE